MGELFSALSRCGSQARLAANMHLYWVGPALHRHQRGDTLDNGPGEKTGLALFALVVREEPAVRHLLRLGYRHCGQWELIGASVTRLRAPERMAIHRLAIHRVG